jgi:8-oxo-dGTP diphosphatase
LAVVGCAESAELRWVPLDQVSTLALHPGLAKSWQRLCVMLTNLDAPAIR